MRRTGETLVVAGVSARWLAESAAQGAWKVVALDLFGDLDTRRVAGHWVSIGDAATLAIDGCRLRQALAGAQHDGAIGWIAGSGFEARPELLGAGGDLPLFGMGAAEVARVRNPAHFFATLDQLGLPYPTTSSHAPAAPLGWIAKRASGTGGWHIRTADTVRQPDADVYYQREQPGESMSALFLADGVRARLVALNRLIVRTQGAHRYVYHGAIGPIHHPALQAHTKDALDALVPAFGLRGLASLDFIAVNETPYLLEINPRPSASMALYPQAWPDGLLRAHVRALQGQLPGAPHHPNDTHGVEILFATRPCCVDAALADALGTLPHCHDLPAAGSRFAIGDPICSVSAQASGPAAVERALAGRRSAIESRMHAEMSA